MKPKEKAQELVDKFSRVGLPVKEKGIQCALILADEMLELCKVVGSDFLGLLYIYWQEVKQEIEKL